MNDGHLSNSQRSSQLDGGSEDLDFVRSRISDPPLEPKCNRISEIPARGRGSRGAMGENMYRPAEADGGLRFRNGVNEEVRLGEDCCDSQFFGQRSN